MCLLHLKAGSRVRFLFYRVLKLYITIYANMNIPNSLSGNVAKELLLLTGFPFSCGSSLVAHGLRNCTCFAEMSVVLAALN